MGDDLDLRVVLLAKGVEVAASTDAAIWLATMAQISGQVATPPAERHGANGGGNPPEAGGGEPIARLAQELSVDREELEFAAAPSMEPPHIQLDHKYWQALKSNTPARGRGAIAPATLAATLLLLWNRHAKFGEVTTKLCSQVLSTIDVRDKNPGRAIKGCDWLQIRGNAVKLNAALINEAKAAARAYCTRSSGNTEA
ncbi:MAG: hypothetical protein ACJ8EB_03965 [Allosphingosinicella sp.]